MSNFVYVLAEGDPNNQFTPAANETKQLMESRECEFWSIGGRNFPWFAKAAIIFPGASRLEAYATIVLNLDRFLPFDQATLPQKAKEEIILAVVDLPSTRKLLEIKGIKGLTPIEFLVSIENDPDGQIIIPVRDLMLNQGSFYTSEV